MSKVTPHSRSHAAGLARNPQEVCGQYALYTVDSAPDDKTRDRTVCPVCDADCINLRHEACPFILRCGDFFRECS
jgi:hypothetical protein